jgi:hypothetical protein
MSTPLAARRALAKTHRQVKEIQELLEDEKVHLGDMVITDAMHVISKLYADRCFPLALEHGVPLREITSAVANAVQGAGHIACARLIVQSNGNLLRVPEEREKAHECIRFAAGRINRMMLLVDAHKP